MIPLLLADRDIGSKDIMVEPGLVNSMGAQHKESIHEKVAKISLRYANFCGKTQAPGEVGQRNLPVEGAGIAP